MDIQISIYRPYIYFFCVLSNQPHYLILGRFILVSLSFFGGCGGWGVC